MSLQFEVDAENGSISFFHDYSLKLQTILKQIAWTQIYDLAYDLQTCWKFGRQVFLCGNGGSAANAIHLANDYLFGVGKECGKGIKVHALSANPAIITCLANDVSYEEIFAKQLEVYADAKDLLIVLSGSGNSPNVLAALQQARKMEMKSYALLGFSGGACKSLADHAIHFPVNDMQIAEDLQSIIGHMLMQWLVKNPPQFELKDLYAETSCYRQ